MALDDDFEPQLGRMRANGRGARGRKFMHRVLAAANLARGGAAKAAGRSRYTGARIGRGAGTGRVLAARDRFAAFRSRRVIVKARTVSLRGAGFDGAKAHLRYVERDGTQRGGERGLLYSAESDGVDRSGWLEKGKGDRHQFRFIISAEDSLEYDDLKSLTRRLMARAEEDLGTSLDWVAVDHFNTGHPHTHIIVRGKDSAGKDLVIARDYIAHGLRERACELVDLDLGPRTDDEISRRLRAEVEQERFTSIDRGLLREAEADILVSSAERGAFDQSIRTGRLRTLERLGLASQHGALHWKLSHDMERVLRRMGERGDIVRTMQRAYSDRTSIPARSDQMIYEPKGGTATPIIGRVVERGLADELHDRHYLIVEATDGRSHYVDIGRGSNLEPLGREAIIRVTPAEPKVRAVDLTIVAVAAANAGRYSVDAHLRHDPAASQAFAEAHVRRLEAIRRLSGGLERYPDGTWVIAADHLERAAAHEQQIVHAAPVLIETLSRLPLETLVDADAPTWLDRQFVVENPTPLREAGFGSEVRAAQNLRRQWLIAQGLAAMSDDVLICRADMLATLQRREFVRAAAEISTQEGKSFFEAISGERIDGRLVRKLELLGGEYAVVERAKDFSLVPWRPVLSKYVGKSVGAIVRDGTVNWAIGRERSGQIIS